MTDIIDKHIPDEEVDKGEYEQDKAKLDEMLRKEIVDIQNDCVTRLQQENEELKKAEKQLTKAKELLKDLIRFQPYINKEAIFLSISNEWKTAVYKAEQFLKEE